MNQLVKSAGNGKAGHTVSNFLRMCLPQMSAKAWDMIKSRF